MTRSVLALFLVLLPGLAQARQIPLEPQNRLHGGLVLSDLSTPGLGLGFDSRLTRLLYVDVGGWMSPLTDGRELPTVDPRQEPEEWFRVRHGLYVAPGLRLPHRVKGKFNWDLIGRAGFGVVWSKDNAYEGDLGLYTNPAVMGGADLVLRYDSVGMRLSGKALTFKPYADSIREEVTLVRPQLGIEALYQW